MVNSYLPRRRNGPLRQLRAVGNGAALAFALRFEAASACNNADEIMAEIIAKRLVEHLERAGLRRFEEADRRRRRGTRARVWKRVTGEHVFDRYGGSRAKTTQTTTAMR